MGEVDSINEILELAISRELDAYHFYTDLAKRATDLKMINIFEGFATEELEHKDKLELEIMKKGNVVLPAERLNSLNIEDYLDDNRPVVDMDYKDVLIMGMAKERRSLRFYIELAAITEDKESRDTLLSLAEEEAIHRGRLEVEYENLLNKQQE